MAFFKKFFNRKSQELIEHGCLPNVLQLSNEVIASIISFLCINEIFKMRYVSSRMHTIIHSGASKSICYESWSKFILDLYPKYNIDEEDRDNPLRQYINYRTLPKYAKNPNQQSYYPNKLNRQIALVAATRENNYPAVKFLLKSGMDIEQKDRPLVKAKEFYNNTLSNRTSLYISLYNESPNMLLLYKIISYNKKYVNRINILYLLLQYGANYNAEVTSQRTYGNLDPGGFRNEAPRFMTIYSKLYNTSEEKRALIHIACAEDGLSLNKSDSFIKKHLEKAHHLDARIFLGYMNNLYSGKSIRRLKEKKLQQIVLIANKVKQKVKEDKKQSNCTIQ